MLDTAGGNLHREADGTMRGRRTGPKNPREDQTTEARRLFFGGNVYSERGPLVDRCFDQGFVAQQRVHRMVLPDLEQKFEAILAGRQWQCLPELATRIPYPGIEEWVNLQISSGQGVKFYPCLIRDIYGATRFLKVQVTRQNGRFGAQTHQIIAKEAMILRSGVLPVRTPAYVDHGDGGETSLAFLCIEAISLEEGQILSGQDWHPGSSKSTATQIRALEGVPLVRLGTLFNEKRSQSTDIGAIIAELILRANSHLDAGLLSDIQALVQDAALPDVFVHGDLTLNNIIVRNSGDAEFIDWETAGIGFLGRDASKVLGGLCDNPAAKDAFITAYVMGKDQVVDQQRLRGLYLGKIAENLTHLVWRVERMTASLESKYPGIREQSIVFQENIRLDVSEYRHQVKKWLLDSK